MPFVHANNLRFHYQQSGAGPDVVLIHPLTGNLALWFVTNTIQSLSASYRVTAYDLRGHGMSDVTPNGYTSNQMAEDLLQICNELDLKSVVLVGHSFGGLVAAHAAYLFPDLVRGVILSDTFFPGLQQFESAPQQHGLWSELREIFSKVEIEIGPELNFERLFHAAARLDDRQLEVVKGCFSIPIGGWLAQLSQLAPTTAGKETFQASGLTHDRIAAIGQPVFALYDEHTEYQKTAEFLEDNISHSQLRTVASAQHLAPLQCSESFIDAVHISLETILGMQIAK